MSIALLLLLANGSVPAVNIGTATHVGRAHAQLQAKARIIKTEKIGPVDRAAIHKGHDRILRRRGDIILVEFF